MGTGRPADDPERALEIARSFPAPLVEKIGLEWLEVGVDRVVARIPVEGNTQPYGQLHGGATASLCETVASVGAAFVAGMGKIVVGTTLTVNHLRAVRHGHVTAIGVPLHSGRTTAVWDMRVVDDDDRLFAVARLTLAVLDAPSPSQ